MSEEPVEKLKETWRRLSFRLELIANASPQHQPDVIAALEKFGEIFRILNSAANPEPSPTRPEDSDHGA